MLYTFIKCYKVVLLLTCGCCALC